MGNEKKYSTIIKVVSIIIGVGMLIAAVYMTMHIQKVRASYDVTMAQIVKITERINHNRKRSHSVYVSYEYDGQTYENVHYNSYDPTMHVGKTISVYVNPEQPGQIESGSYTAVTILMPMAFIIIFVGTLVSKILGGGSSAKQIKELRENGLRIDAVIETTVENNKIRINGKCPFQIHCKYEDSISGSTYYFVSDNIYGFERNVFTTGSIIPVYVDRTDYGKYFVDYSVALNPQWNI